MKTPNEKWRIISGAFASDPSYGPVGAWMIPFQDKFVLQCIATDGQGISPWEHVSVVAYEKHKSTLLLWRKAPTWPMMCWIKDQFWSREETVLQYHPPESKYINNHPTCLHLWRHKEIEMPLPDTFLLGSTKLNL